MGQDAVYGRSSHPRRPCLRRLQVLKALGYNSHPEKVQAIIRRVYEDGLARIRIEGTEV